MRPKSLRRRRRGGSAGPWVGRRAAEMISPSLSVGRLAARAYWLLLAAGTRAQQHTHIPGSERTADPAAAASVQA